LCLIILEYILSFISLSRINHCFSIGSLNFENLSFQLPVTGHHSLISKMLNLMNLRSY